jgi:hypothetical protein
MKKHTNEELTQKEPPAFALTRGSVRAIDLLNDNLYTKIFTEKTTPCGDIILSYRLFFLLINKPEIAEIQDKDSFWERTCTYFLKECNNDIGKAVHESIKSLNLSCENLMKIQKLVGNNPGRITPQYFSKLCGTTGLIAFLLKDAFEYAGITVDKKTPAFNLYRFENYQQIELTQKLEKLKNLQAKIF